MRKRLKQRVGQPVHHRVAVQGVQNRIPLRGRRRVRYRRPDLIMPFAIKGVEISNVEVIIRGTAVGDIRPQRAHIRPGVSVNAIKRGDQRGDKNPPFRRRSKTKLAKRHRLIVSSTPSVVIMIANINLNCKQRGYPGSGALRLPGEPIITSRVARFALRLAGLPGMPRYAQYQAVRHLRVSGFSTSTIRNITKPIIKVITQ